MKNEFVPYAEALALKELGFNDSAFGYYNIDPQLKTPAFNLAKPFDHEWCLPAPLYQQAFRWFREKEYDFNIVKELSNDLVTRVYVYWCGYLGIGIDRSEEYETYEEAELACLVKLIEIVKK